MSTRRTVLTIISIIAVVAFGIAACGADQESATTGPGGGDINITVTSFPDYVDPQLSYTVEGSEVLWNVYTPLLTYKHERGEAGTQVVPGLAEDMPEISPDGKTYKLKLRSNMKYSDGTPDQGLRLHLRDPTAVQDRFRRVGVLRRHRRCHGLRRRQGQHDQRHHHQRRDRRHHHRADRPPTAPSTTCLGLMFAAPVPQNTPLDTDATNNPPPSSGPFMISKVDAPRTLTMERNPNFQTVKDAGATEVADAQVDSITVTENKNNSAQVTDVEQNKIDFMVEPPAADRLAEVKSRYGDRFRLEESINTYYFFMNTQKPPFNDLRVRQAINYAVDPEALNRIFGGRLHPSQQILPPGMPGYQEFKLYPGPDMDEGEAADRRSQPGRPRHHRLDR